VRRVLSGSRVVFKQTVEAVYNNSEDAVDGEDDERHRERLYLQSEVIHLVTFRADWVGVFHYSELNLEGKYYDRSRDHDHKRVVNENP